MRESALALIGKPVEPELPKRIRLKISRGEDSFDGGQSQRAPVGREGSTHTLHRDEEPDG